MLSRVFRPLRVPSASLVPAPIRFVLPIRTRTFATSAIETQAPASSPELSLLPKSSPPSSSPETPETATLTPPPTPEAPATAEAAVPPEAAAPTEAATPTTATPTEVPARTQASPPKKASSSKEAPTPAPRQLPYFVGRNPFENFGVYQRRKRGGNLKVTLVKKGEGNLQALKHDIKNALELRDDEVAVNSVTRHVVVKGFRKDEIVHFLRTMGF